MSNQVKDIPEDFNPIKDCSHKILAISDTMEILNGKCLLLHVYAISRCAIPNY